MKSYRRRREAEKKTKKILLRILFVIIAAGVIFGLSVLLGHYLQKKADSVEIPGTDDVPDTQSTAEQNQNPQEFVITSTAAPSVKSAYIRIENLGDTDTGETAQSLMGHYDTVIIDLRTRSGELCYSSAAVCEMVGVKPAEGDDGLETVKRTISSMKGAGMRLCAIIPSSVDRPVSVAASLIDSALIRELYEMGFDEVIPEITDFYRETLSYDRALEIQKYITECSEATSGEQPYIGIILPFKCYTESSYARALQLLVSAASFVCVDFDTDGDMPQADVFASVSRDMASMRGSFSLYNVRVIIDGDTKEKMAAEYTACRFESIGNICVMGTFLPEDLDYDLSSSDSTEEDTEPDETGVPDETDNTNPYYSGKDDYPDYDPSTDTVDDDTERPWY